MVLGGMLDEVWMKMRRVSVGWWEGDLIGLLSDEGASCIGKERLILWSRLPLC